MYRQPGRVHYRIGFSCVILAFLEVLPVWSFLIFLSGHCAWPLAHHPQHSPNRGARFASSAPTYFALANPLFPSKYIFYAAPFRFIIPDCARPATVILRLTYGITVVSILLAISTFALSIMPIALRRYPNSGSILHMTCLPKEYKEWARIRWGGFPTTVLSIAAPFVIWASVQEERGNFSMPPRQSLFLLWKSLRGILLLMSIPLCGVPFIAWGVLAA